MFDNKSQYFLKKNLFAKRVTLFDMILFLKIECLIVNVNIFQESTFTKTFINGIVYKESNLIAELAKEYETGQVVPLKAICYRKNYIECHLMDHRYFYQLDNYQLRQLSMSCFLILASFNRTGGLDNIFI